VFLKKSVGIGNRVEMVKYKGIETYTGIEIEMVVIHVQINILMLEDVVCL
jgi:hypothetical protein